MLASEQTNSSPVKKNSTFMETVQDKLKDIKNFSNWSAKEQMIAVGAVGVMVGALLPFVAVALPVAATGAIVALTLFFAYKAVEYTFKGLKWSAEKTVDGAKYTAGKVKDASTYAAGKIRDGAVHAKDKIKSSTSHVVHNVSQSLDRLSSQTNYSDAMLNSQLLSGDVKGRIAGIKKQLMGIFNNEEIANKDKLIKRILKDIVLQIESKKDHAQGTDSEKYVPEWDKQINFIKNLNAEKLHDLLTKQSSPKDTYFLYTIFSEHHDKVERIVKQCKTEHGLSNVVENLNKVAGKYGTLRESIQFGGSNVEKQLHEPFSSDLGVLDKTATIGQKPSGKQSIPVALPKVPESASMNSFGSSMPTNPLGGESEQSSSKDELHAAIKKDLREFCSSTKAEFTHSSSSNHDGSDSGFNSPTSSPVHGLFTNKDGKVGTQADLNPTNHTLWEQPSTRVGENSVHHPAGVKTK